MREALLPVVAEGLGPLHAPVLALVVVLASGSVRPGREERPAGAHVVAQRAAVWVSETAKLDVSCVEAVVQAQVDSLGEQSSRTRPR